MVGRTVRRRACRARRMYIQHQRRAARMGEVMETQVKSCKWNKDTTRELLDCILESIIIPPHSQAFVSISWKAYPSFRARQIITRTRIGASLLLAEASAVLCYVCVHAKFTRGMHPASSLRVCHQLGMSRTHIRDSHSLPIGCYII